MWSLGPGYREFWILVTFGVIPLLSWLLLQALHTYRSLRRGELFIIREESQDWDREVENLKNFISLSQRYYAEVRTVPGPEQLHRWRWSLDANTSTWDEKTHDLLTAFRVVRLASRSERTVTIAVWAWWSVALVLAGRIRYADPGLALRICPRPSETGRQGQRGDPDVRRFCTYPHDPQIPAVGDLRPFTYSWKQPWRRLARRAPLTARTHEYQATLKPQATGEPSAEEQAEQPGRPVFILLVRTTTGRWAGLPSLAGGAAPVQEPLSISLEDHAGLKLPPTVDCTVLEWRCTAPPGAFLTNHESPVLAQAAARWIMETSAARGDAVLLLGATMPVEVAAGIGILAHAPDGDRWPRHLYPLQYVRSRDRFVVPNLDLGQAGLHQGYRP